MHLLPLLMVALLVVGFLLWRQSQGRQERVQPGQATMPGAGSQAFELAFISNGKMFLHVPGQELREVQSPHAQAQVDRLERSRQLHAWKQDTAFATAFASRRMRTADGEPIPLQASSIRFVDQQRLLYFLHDERVGGLFEYVLESGLENRLLHRQNLRIDDLAPSVDGTRLLCSQHASNGSANICLLNADGSGFRELTGGDTVDSAPAWIPGEADQILFQTTGIARNPAGAVMAHGPTAIQMLDTGKGTVTPVLEDPAFDYLQPRVTADGLLLYLRRPYDAPQYRSSQMFADTLLFPFRLLRALFHYLNFFSLMYTRKPLTSASGPLLEQDLKEILVKGKRMDAEAELRKGRQVLGVPSLVPQNWQLWRRDRQGRDQLLATHVASFDLAADGSLYYTNGYGVFRISSRGSELILRDKLIAEIVVGRAV